MNRRVRTLAGLLALVAMTLSFTEVGMASMCASMADMADMDGMVMEGSGEDPASDMACPLASGQEEGRPGHCPLNPVVDSGCAPTATLPSVPSVAVPPPPVSPPSAVPDRERPALILAVALFRPPRA